MAKKSVTYTGAKKPFGRSGHFHQSRRHSLQARGIRTGRKSWEKIGDVAKPSLQSMYGLKGKQDVVWLDNWDRGNWAVVRGKEIAPMTYDEESVITNFKNKKQAKSFLKEYLESPDSDGDGVPDAQDCDPTDPDRQDLKVEIVEDVRDNSYEVFEFDTDKLLGVFHSEKELKDAININKWDTGE